jgi:hypothetical protein
MRLALFDRHGVTFSLVPGGTVPVGYDAGRFEVTPALAASYSQYRAGCTDPLAVPDILDLVASRTTSARTVAIGTLLVAVEAREAGVTECRPDNPRIVDLMARVPDVPSIRGNRRLEWNLLARVWRSADGAVDRAWLIDVPSYDEVVLDLAGRGERMATPDEWEYLCGAGVTTLWRWGDQCPMDVLPVPDSDGPHREPNLFGLTIGDNPFNAERTSVREVVCGGDGGVWLHHEDFGQLGAWLPLATAYRDTKHGAYVAERDGQLVPRIRPVIELER